MKMAYKFRLYPTKEQEQKLLRTLDRCRHVYNFLLSELQQQKVIDKLQLQEMVVDLKRIEPELKNVHSKVLQYENYRWLSKIGEIPFIMHRDIEGKIKQITIKHHPSGKWYASIIAETKDEIRVTQNKEKVGLDLGTMNYVYDSDGNHSDNPKHLDKSLGKLQKGQRRLSRKRKGSQNRNKQRISVARVHEKIINQRDDFLHKLSRYYVDKYGFIAVEDLQIKNMVRNCHLAKSISDASWSKFIQMLEFKAERAGVRVVKVEPRGTTQICSSCGTKVHKELWNRTHKCTCGLEINRDYNSAMNILKRALGQELSKSTPVEREPLLAEMQASNLEETGSHILNVKH